MSRSGAGTSVPAPRAHTGNRCHCNEPATWLLVASPVNPEQAPLAGPICAREEL